MTTSIYICINAYVFAGRNFLKDTFFLKSQIMYYAEISLISNFERLKLGFPTDLEVNFLIYGIENRTNSRSQFFFQ
jgi:hypothetical protein